jgi:hypothetical protein
MRFLVTAILLSTCAAGQISAPVIGYLRDLAGMLRPVSGIAGAFVLGEPVESGIIEARFLGTSGCAWTETGTIAFRNGQRIDDSTTCPATSSAVRIEGDEAVIEATGVRIRVPSPVSAVEQMADQWYVLRAAAALYAFHTRPGAETLYQLPEAAR